MNSMTVPFPFGMHPAGATCDGMESADRGGSALPLQGVHGSALEVQPGQGVPSRAMLKKILHWAIAAAVVLHLFALLVQGQAFLPGF